MEYSLADIRAVTEGEDKGTWGENGFLWVILIFLFFLAFSGGLGNGFGNNGNNGLAQVERDVLTTSCATQREVLDSRYTTQLGFQTAQAQLSSCCCDLKTAIHAEGEQTRALITSNVIQDLRDRLALANNALTSQTLSESIISALQPKTPIPAYITCSPYQSAYYGYNAFNNGFGGCGCGNI